MKSKDNSLYDLSPRGSADLNGRAPIRDHIYYFSYGASATVRAKFWERQWYRPEKFMSQVFKPIATLLGSCLKLCQKQIPIDSSWLENDGAVNTRSTLSPTLNSYDPRVSYQEGSQPLPAVWNYMGTLKSYDHMQVVGFGNDRDKPILPLYSKIASLLGSLPVED